MSTIIDGANRVGDIITKLTGVVLPYQVILLGAVLFAILGVYLVYKGIKAKLTAIIIVGICFVSPAAWSIVKSMLVYVFSFIRSNI